LKTEPCRLTLLFVPWWMFALTCTGLTLGATARLEVPTTHENLLLVAPEWLRDHLSGKSLVVVDTRSEADYSKGHIPGSVWMDAAVLSGTTSDEGLRLLKEDLAVKFAPLGINGGEIVVFYEDGIGVRAPRALWYYTYAGYRTGKVLAGGFQTWQASHFPVSQERSLRTSRPLVVKVNPRVMATTNFVARRLNDPGVVLLDVRSYEEYIGKEINSQFTRGGHIPGARWLEWGRLLEGNLRYLPKNDLEKRLAQVGVMPDREVIVYCQRGNRASNTFLALQLLGFPKVRNYVGSWQEWSSHSDHPLSTGEPTSGK
jgi:thiosulfate/3-mercaptopyruvate sulfurtransferase